VFSHIDSEMKTLWFMAMFACVAANAAPVVFQSSERQTALVELYTSEGCSSCPPAESWLSSLKKESGLWSDFVPVGFHVEYWDYLGWRDKWSSKQFTDRQRAYTSLSHGDSIYTPEFIVNGKEWRDWSGSKTIPVQPRNQPGILKVSSDDGVHWRAAFAPDVSLGSHFEINAALLDSEVGSDVKAGENM